MTSFLFMYKMFKIKSANGQMTKVNSSNERGKQEDSNELLMKTQNKIDIEI